MDPEDRRFYQNTSSSYLSLKAELLRKKQDLQRVSSSASSEPSSSTILDHLQASSSSLRLKSKGELDVEVANPSKKKKKEQDKEIPSPAPSSSTSSRADDIALAKSRSILEAKAKLYDEIMSNNEMKALAEDDDPEENDKAFLVDFERKIYENNSQSTKVEYVDEFGRTRWIEPDEYQRLTSSEKKNSSEKLSSKQNEQEIERAERLHREQMRSKWEAEMEELRNKAEVHYQDVLFDEKREHGVGFYRFSTDDKQRAEQMATLTELRNKTKLEQMKTSQEKDQRHSIMSERLNKILVRKAKEMGIQLGGNHSTPTTNNEPEAKIEDSSKPVVEEKNENSTEIKTSEAQPCRDKSVEIVPPSTINSHSRPSTDPNFAYPFPVMRAVRTSDSSSTQPSSSSS